MGRISKFILFIAALIGIGFSVCLYSLFYPVPFITDILRENLALDWLNQVFAGYNALIGLCFFVILLVVLFIPSNSDFLNIKKDKGNLQFSKKTIESTVRYSFIDLDGIISSDIRVKFNKDPDKTKIYVRLFLRDPSQLLDLTETIQSRIECTLQSSLGIAVNSIVIRVVESNPSVQGSKGTAQDSTNGGRVV